MITITPRPKPDGYWKERLDAASAVYQRHAEAARRHQTLADTAFNEMLAINAESNADRPDANDEDRETARRLRARADKLAADDARRARAAAPAPDDEHPGANEAAAGPDGAITERFHRRPGETHPADQGSGDADEG